MILSSVKIKIRFTEKIDVQKIDLLKFMIVKALFPLYDIVKIWEDSLYYEFYSIEYSVLEDVIKLTHQFLDAVGVKERYIDNHEGTTLANVEWADAPDKELFYITEINKHPNGMGTSIKLQYETFVDKLVGDLTIDEVRACVVSSVPAKMIEGIEDNVVRTVYGYLKTANIFMRTYLFNINGDIREVIAYMLNEGEYSGLCSNKGEHILWVDEDDGKLEIFKSLIRVLVIYTLNSLADYGISNNTVLQCRKYGG